MRPFLVVLGLVLAGLLGGADRAHAHGSSNAYLSITRAGSALDVQWEIALRDLDYAVGLDAAPDGAITWGSLRDHLPAIEAYALPRLALTGDGRACPAGPVRLLFDRHGDGGYAVLRFTAACPATPSRIGVAYRLLFDLDPQHRGLLRLVSGGASHAQVLGPADQQASFDVAGDDAATFAEFFRTGVEHILGGYDHLLFIAVLLVPAICRRADGRWLPVDRFSIAFAETVKTLSAFTLAHALTLTCAVLGIVALPARLTESAIALTIILTAIDNIRPVFGGRRWMLGFGFGLIHGFGFASALGPLDLPGASLAVALVSFNLGIEAVQVAIVVAVLPLVYLLRARRGFLARFVPAASSMALALALLWLIDRALDLRMMPI